MGEGYVFTGVCLLTGGGVPHLHPIILLLVPCSFLGGGGINPDLTGVPPPSLPGQGTPPPVLTWSGQDRGWDHSQVRMGIPLSARTGMGPPSQVRMGYSPLPLLGRAMDCVFCSRYASCGFPQEDFSCVCLDSLNIQYTSKLNWLTT